MYLQTKRSGGIKGLDILGLVTGLKKILRPFKLGLDHCHALLVIKAFPGSTPKGMAKALAVYPPQVTRVTDRLAFRGLITREVGEDRRTVRCYLTEKGNLLLADIDKHIFII